MARLLVSLLSVHTIYFHAHKAYPAMTHHKQMDLMSLFTSTTSVCAHCCLFVIFLFLLKTINKKLPYSAFLSTY